MLAYKERVEEIGKETWFDWTIAHIDRAEEARELVAAVEELIRQASRTEIEMAYGRRASKCAPLFPPPSAQMTPAQCRAARSFIGLSQSQLGFMAVVPLGTIIDFEAEAMTPNDEELDALQDTFQWAGVELLRAG